MNTIVKIISLFLLLIIMACSETDKLHNKALSENSKGNYEEAIKIWNEILTIEQDNPLYLNDLGWTLFRNDNFEQAKAALEKAKAKCKNKSLMKSIETNLDMVLTFQNGKELLEAGNYDAALIEFEKVLAKYSTKDVGMKYLALCYEGMEKYEEANEQWEKIIDIYKNSNVSNKFYILAQEKFSKLE